jgi:pSer/pThr/pTyr-binding forkhead associated (FHA) protein
MSKTGDATTGALRFDPTDLAGEGQESEAGELAADPADLTGAVSDLEPGTALLVVVRGPNNGARFLLDRDTVTVGRHPDSDIFLDDITVSRRHVEFRREGGRFAVHDVGSLNGTYVNGVRADDAMLAMGDEVQIGKFKLVVFLPESDA